jgi:peptide/nickel transport system permease protein
VATLAHSTVAYQLVGRSADVGFVTPTLPAQAAEIVREIRGLQAAASRGDDNAAIALAIVSVPQFARITRVSVLGEKQREYVQAARCLGAGDFGIALRHILPNTISPLLVQLSLAMAYAVLLEAGLSFLGLGAQPPDPSWGSMLNASRQYLRQAPWYAIFPGIALSALLLGLNFFSDALRDALDPKLSHLR